VKVYGRASKNENDIKEEGFSGGVKKLYTQVPCLHVRESSNFLIALSRQQECASKINGAKRALALCEAVYANREMTKAF
jgi:hypothetical protein